jgi:hypothetical protein
MTSMIGLETTSKYGPSVEEYKIFDSHTNPICFTRELWADVTRNPSSIYEYNAREVFSLTFSDEYFAQHPRLKYSFVIRAGRRYQLQ